RPAGSVAAGGGQRRRRRRSGKGGSAARGAALPQFPELSDGTQVLTPFRPQLLVLQPTPYCNIDCSYCYLRHRDDRRLMGADVIEAVRNKIVSAMPADSAPVIVWHAGEPTVAPIRWYEHAHERLAAVAPPRTSFAMQSNGIAIDERWIALFARTGTNVSLSIDGPQRFHDQRRRTRNGAPTWGLAMRGLKRLQDAGLEPRLITVL